MRLRHRAKIVEYRKTRKNNLVYVLNKWSHNGTKVNPNKGKYLTRYAMRLQYKKHYKDLERELSHAYY